MGLKKNNNLAHSANYTALEIHKDANKQFLLINKKIFFYLKHKNIHIFVVLI